MQTDLPVAADINPLASFQWEPQPLAEKFVRGLVDDFLKRTRYAAGLAREMTEETGTRFFDWVESIVLSPSMENEIAAAGFKPVQSDVHGMHAHPGGMFPTIITDRASRFDMTIRVESGFCGGAKPAAVDGGRTAVPVPADAGCPRRRDGIMGSRTARILRVSAAADRCRKADQDALPPRALPHSPTRFRTGRGGVPPSESPARCGHPRSGR
jgi:hypothetical protein